jgi:hypothetical protein
LLSFTDSSTWSSLTFHSSLGEPLVVERPYGVSAHPFVEYPLPRDLSAREDFGPMLTKGIGHSAWVVGDAVLIFDDEVHRAVAREGFLESTQNVFLPAMVFEFREVFSGTVELSYPVKATRAGEFLSLLVESVKKGAAAMRSRHSSTFLIYVQESTKLTFSALAQRIRSPA